MEAGARLDSARCSDRISHGDGSARLGSLRKGHPRNTHDGCYPVYLARTRRYRSPFLTWLSMGRRNRPRPILGFSHLKTQHYIPTAAIGLLLSRQAIEVPSGSTKRTLSTLVVALSVRSFVATVGAVILLLIVGMLSRGYPPRCWRL
jgi:hypothetical protein